MPSRPMRARGLKRLSHGDSLLIEKPEGGVATIVSDEFFNVFDKTGPGMSNYKPSPLTTSWPDRRELEQSHCDF
jgi:hypothetical protein